MTLAVIALSIAYVVVAALLLFVVSLVPTPAR